MNLLIDFFTKRTQNWWRRWIRDFRRINLTFDGLWIDMNEPGENLNFPIHFDFVLKFFFSVIWHE